MKVLILVFLAIFSIVAENFEFENGYGPLESFQYAEVRAKRDGEFTTKEIKTTVKSEAPFSFLHVIIYIAVTLVLIGASVAVTWMMMTKIEHKVSGSDDEDFDEEDLKEEEEDPEEEEDDEDEDEDGFKYKDDYKELPEMDEEMDWFWGEEDDKEMRYYAYKGDTETVLQGIDYKDWFKEQDSEL